MHITMAVLWPFSVLLTVALGFIAGVAFAAHFGTSAMVAYAKRSVDEDAEHEDTEPEDDEESRLDALAIRDLMLAADRITVDSPEPGTYRVGGITELHKAVEAAEARFAGWVEWAEGATKTALAPAEDGAAI